MDYELARQLKEAGFYQPSRGYDIPFRGIYILPDARDSNICAYAPTLEELIEACGEDFRTLILHTQYTKKLKEPWEAIPNRKRCPEVRGQKGTTALEAMAKLWLALNRKA